MQDYERTTRAPARSGGRRQSDRVHTLTVVSHPRIERIGQRVLLPELSHAGRAVELSRKTPAFSDPGKVWGEPLDDLYLSRSPLRLVRTRAGGIEVSRELNAMEVRVSGRPLNDRLDLDARMVERGVDFELGGRVALVLHFVDPNAEDSDNAFGLVGESDAIRRTRLAVSRVADLDVTVLLRGESGTGKEIVARAIHDNGPRAAGPFVAVNLSAITPSLATSELFGAVKGAYTGSISDRQGLFVSANKGTLFLDEVGDCPIEVQAMLLRALETSEVWPVGSRTPKKVDVRLVAATDSNLENKAREGEFKEPLLHRLSTYEIAMSPLRRRSDDIGRLILHFAREARRSLGKELPGSLANADGPPWIPAELAARCVRFDWPGNVRQLRNLIWQLVIDGRDARQLRIDERSRRLFEGAVENKAEAETEGRTKPTGRRRPGSITEDELAEAMEDSGWSVTGAAKSLGISRASLYELIHRSSRVRTADEVRPAEIQDAVGACGGDVAKAAAALRVSERGLKRRIGKLGDV